MSRHLVKIISVCALIVLLPLLIVGTALSVTEAVSYTVSIFEDGNDGHNYQDILSSKMTIYVDGEPVLDEAGQPATSVSVKKYTEVTVEFVGSEGYVFDGWFNGNPAEITADSTAASDLNSYTFTVKGRTNLTAIRNVRTYQVTYAGEYDNGDPVDIVPATQTVEYNQLLQALSPKAGASYEGWYVFTEGGTNTAGQLRATFGTLESVVLHPAWSDQMVITYYASDKNTIIEQSRLSEQQYESYQLLAADNEKVVANLTPGYEFTAWTNVAGDPIVLPEDYVGGSEVKIYLKETAITYPLTVKFSAIDDRTDNISFNAESKFTAYSVTRDGYTFKGISCDGELYTYSGNDLINTAGKSLGDKVIESDGQLTLTAVWASNYTDIEWTYGFGYAPDNSGIMGVYVKNGESYNLINSVNEFLVFEDVAEEGYARLEDMIIATNFDIDLSNLYVLDGGEYKLAKITGIRVYMNNDTFNPIAYDGIESDTTYKDIYDTALTDGETEISKITVRFMVGIA